MQDTTWTKLDAVLEKYGIFRIYNPQTMTCNLMMGDEKVGYIELNTEVATGAKLPMVRFLPGTTIKTAGLFNIANEDMIAELEKYLIDMLGPRDGKVITVQYLNDSVKRLSIEKKGDWIDMYAAETVEMKQGEHKLIHLGVAMKLPEGYEAHLEEVRNCKCSTCGKHDCPSLEYGTDLLGNPGWPSISPEKCPAIINGTAKCPHCGKILVEDNRWQTEPDKYCDGKCNINFG